MREDDLLAAKLGGYPIVNRYGGASIAILN